MGHKRVGLEARIKKWLENRLLREYLGRAGHVSLDLVQFELEIESELDALGFDCFSSRRTINMYLMIFVKERTSSRFATTPWRTAAPNSRVFIQVSAMLP